MKHRTLTTATAICALTVALTGCVGSDQEAHTPPPSPAPTPSATPSTTPSIPPSDSAAGSTPPSIPSSPQATDACGVFQEMVDAIDALNGMSETERVDAMGSTLDFYSASADALSSQRQAPEWAEMHDAYTAAADFYAVSGHALSNDDFLYLYAQAVETSDAAVDAENEYALSECGVDLAPLLSRQAQDGEAR